MALTHQETIFLVLMTSLWGNVYTHIFHCLGGTIREVLFIRVAHYNLLKFCNGFHLGLFEHVNT